MAVCVCPQKAVRLAVLWPAVARCERFPKQVSSPTFVVSKPMVAVTHCHWTRRWYQDEAMLLTYDHLNGLGIVHGAATGQLSSMIERAATGRILG